MSTKELVVEMEDLIDSVVAAVAEGAEITIVGCGSSMQPLIDESRDKLVLRSASPEAVRVGEIYLYRRQNGRYAIHRVYSVDGDTVSMLGDMQYYIERGVPRSSLLAQAVRIIKPDGVVELTDEDILRSGAAHMKKRIRHARVRRILRLPWRIARKILRWLKGERR